MILCKMPFRTGKARADREQVTGKLLCRITKKPPALSEKTQAAFFADNGNKKYQYTLQ